MIPFPTSFGEALRTFYTTNVSNFVHFVRCVQVSEFGGAFEEQHAFWGGKIEFHEVSPPPRCQNFRPPEFFSIHFFRNFFPDISNFFQTFKNCPGPPKIFLRPTKNVIFLATFHKFLHFCLSNSDISTTFGHFSQTSPLWFLHPWLSATNGFYRNYQELGGGQNGRAENNLGGGAFAPLAPPPGAGTGCVFEMHC